MTIPNMLTTLRLILIPIFVYVVVSCNNLIVAAIIFIFAGFTDVLDGFIARRLGQMSDFGKLYDPLVDKLMQIAAVSCLYVSIKDIPDWVLVFIIAKESLMIITSAILYLKKVVVHSLIYGKIASVLFYISIFFMMIIPNLNATSSSIFITIIIISAVTSLVNYFIEFILKNKGKTI